MLNKRKKYINNYNKLYFTIDKNTTLNLEPAVNSDIVVNSDTVINSDTDKMQLDKKLNEISAHYLSNNYNSSNFTGKINTDYCSIFDPNKYKENINEECHNHTKYIHKNITAEIVKETIYIEEDINNISDIIQLTEKYKLDPDIIYNINMRALHDIKIPLEELNNMIGMNNLKTNIVDQILYFVQDLHKNSNHSGDFMHTVIYGPPGTGKTEIAKIMGKIYSNIGILKKGTFKKVTRSDLIAGYLGQTTLKTRDVIKESLGGVLFIDEAYALGNSEKRDSFAKECIDTLCEALSDNKENLMVIIAGYEIELKECFFNYNQGLDSRFTWRFKTDNYSAEDLHKIFIKKVKDIGWELHKDSKITSDFFKKNYEYFPFFGRDIENVLAKTKIAHGKRIFCKPENEKKQITLQDLEKGFENYLKNDNIQNRKEMEYKKQQLYYSLYS